MLPKIIINSQYSSLQTLKHQNVLVTEPQFVIYTVGDGILYYFLEQSIIPTDVVLELGKLDKVIDSLAIIWKRDYYNSILIVILW